MLENLRRAPLLLLPATGGGGNLGACVFIWTTKLKITTAIDAIHGNAIVWT